jgi:hypothetical protein
MVKRYQFFEKKVRFLYESTTDVHIKLYNTARLYCRFSLDNRDVYIVLYTRLLSIHKEILLFYLKNDACYIINSLRLLKGYMAVYKRLFAI